MTDYAIIGDGAAGTAAAFYIRRHDPRGRIRIYSDDPAPSYYRAALTNYLMGELRAEQLFATPPTFYSEFNVERVLTRVNAVDAKDQRLQLSTGQRAPYDHLMIAAGSRARSPSFPGSDLPGIMTMRTIQDARFIMDQVQAGRLKHAIIVGGGILGLELVAGLRANKVDVTYLIRGTLFMPGILDQVASDLVIARCRHFGVDVRLDEEVGDVYAGHDGSLHAIRLKNSGATVESQLLAVAIGIIPNTEFLEGSGIQVNRGVPVDDHMRTNVPNVYAGGDIAEVKDPRSGGARVLGLWEPARHHGRTAGINMTGGDETWQLQVGYNATRLYDLDLAAVGDTLEKPDDDVIIEFPETGGSIVYKKLVLRDNRLVGALLLGQRKEEPRARARLFQRLISLRTDVSSIRDMLLDPFFDLAEWIASVEDQTPAPAPTAGRPPVAAPARPDMSRIMGRIVPDAAAAPVPVETPGDPAASPELERREAIPSAPQEAPARKTSLSGLMQVVPGLTQVSEARADAVGMGRGTAILEGGAGVATLKLHDGSVVTVAERLSIGRNPDNDLVVDDPLVSGSHAEIRRQGSDYVLADIGSRNGTFLNEGRVGDIPASIRHNDVIRVGTTTVTFIRQVLPPRSESGPAGLPDEPLTRASGEGELLGVVNWGERRYEIRSDVQQIGRDPHESEIQLDDPAVSWLHAEIVRHDGALYLRDYGSRNGTFVNGNLVTVPHLLSDGDVIHVGNTDLTFRAAAGAHAGQRAESAASAGAEDAGPRLVGRAGSVLGVPFALRGPSTSVGRDPDSDIVVNEQMVSRRHASLEERGGEWAIVDHGSTNGTFVNGERVDAGERRTLRPGVEIKLGTVAFTFDFGRGLAPAARPEAKSRSAGSTQSLDTAAVAGATRPLSTGDVVAPPERGPAQTVAGAPAQSEPPVVKAAEPAAEGPGPSVPKAAEERLALVVTAGPAEGKTLSLDTLPLVLGRADAPGITGMSDQYVSGRHLEITRAEDGTLVIVDLGSTNGTRLNDVALEARVRQPVGAGDRIALGPTTVMEVRPE